MKPSARSKGHGLGSDLSSNDGPDRLQSIENNRQRQLEAQADDPERLLASVKAVVAGLARAPNLHPQKMRKDLVANHGIARARVEKLTDAQVGCIHPTYLHLISAMGHLDNALIALKSGNNALSIIDRNPELRFAVRDAFHRAISHAYYAGIEAAHTQSSIEKRLARKDQEESLCRLIEQALQQPTSSKVKERVNLVGIILDNIKAMADQPKYSDLVEKRKDGFYYATDTLDKKGAQQWVALPGRKRIQNLVSERGYALPK